jgi:hypothetical protein
MDKLHILYQYKKNKKKLNVDIERFWEKEINHHKV